METIVKTSTVDRIAAVVKQVTGRLRVNGFDVVGIGAQATRTDGLISLQIQADTTLDTHRIAYYLGCRHLHVAGDTYMYEDVKLVGTQAMVSVFGPAPVEVTA